jgi:hypothetical protein
MSLYKHIFFGDLKKQVFYGHFEISHFELVDNNYLSGKNFVIVPETWVIIE